MFKHNLVRCLNPLRFRDWINNESVSLVTSPNQQPKVRFMFEVMVFVTVSSGIG